MPQKRERYKQADKYKNKMKALGLAIREKILDKGMKQYEVATKIGISPAHMGRVLAGEQFSLEVLFALEEVLEYEFVNCTNQRKPEDRRAERIGNMVLNLRDELFE